MPCKGFHIYYNPKQITNVGRPVAVIKMYTCVYIAMPAVWWVKLTSTNEHSAYMCHRWIHTAYIMRSTVAGRPWLVDMNFNQVVTNLNPINKPLEWIPD